MTGLYDPKVGDRVEYNNRPGYRGTVKAVVLEDHFNSGYVMVHWDGSTELCRVHRRTLKKVGK